MDNNEKEKQVFDEMYQKQVGRTKKILLITFGCMGFFLVVLGLILSQAETKELIFICYLGLAFIFLGVVLFLAIPAKYDYEKVKKRTQKYGYFNYFQMSAKISYLDEKNKELEERIAELEKRIM